MSGQIFRNPAVAELRSSQDFLLKSGFRCRIQNSCFDWSRLAVLRQPQMTLLEHPPTRAPIKTQTNSTSLILSMFISRLAKLNTTVFTVFYILSPKLSTSSVSHKTGKTCFLSHTTTKTTPEPEPTGSLEGNKQPCVICWSRMAVDPSAILRRHRVVCLFLSFINHIFMFICFQSCSTARPPDWRVSDEGC